MTDLIKKVRELEQALAEANQKIAKAQEECNAEIDELRITKKLGDDHSLMEDYDIQLDLWSSHK